jgi:hypothetical protein
VKAVQVADFMEHGSPRVGLKVRVRVPSAQQEKLGKQIVGEFRSFRAKGRRVLVLLKVGSRLLEFRPQDVLGEVAAKRQTPTAAAA